MKNRHTLSLLIKQSRKLQHQRLEIYLQLLTQLCREHYRLNGISDLLHALRVRDFDSVLAIADSWASQKYETLQEHFLKNQFAALIRKYPWGKLVKADPLESAKKKFFSAEHHCHRINQRFKARRNNNSGANEQYLQRMRDFITYVIGFAPDIEKVMDNASFGPGANVGVSRSTNNARKLLAPKWTVSPGAFTYGYISVMRNVHFRGILIPEHACFTSGDGDYALERERYHSKALLVKHNKIAFVPKTALVHRTIAIEPLINGYLQKGVDVVLKRMLKRVGINLEDQSRNQEYARTGSIPGDEDPFCTIDLSSASDSIAIEMVREVLPFDWFYFLDSIRSKEYKLDNKFYTYNKFCSMGNGFCFPLETLVFTAACVAVGAGEPGKDFLVYGDDIIVRKSVYEPLIELLAYLGFTTNPRKTFSTGPFRESCGADWYEGKDVRPFTLDFALDSVQSIFKILNLSRRNERTEMFFLQVRDFLINLLPVSLRFFRPHPRAADTGIDSTGDEHLYSPNCRFDQHQGIWICKSLQQSAIPDNFWHREDTRGLIALWGAMVGAASTAPFSFRGKTRTKVRWEANSGSSCTWTPS